MNIGLDSISFIPQKNEKSRRIAINACVYLRKMRWDAVDARVTTLIMRVRLYYKRYDELSRVHASRAHASVNVRAAVIRAALYLTVYCVRDVILWYVASGSFSHWTVRSPARSLASITWTTNSTNKLERVPMDHLRTNRFVEFARIWERDEDHLARQVHRILSCDRISSLSRAR